MKYEIMGSIVNICVEDEEIKKILECEFEIYNKAEGQAIANVYIVDKINIDYEYSNTPSIHKTFKNGFLAEFGGNKVLYKKEKLLEMYVEINKKKHFLRKFIDIAYKYNLEKVGHVLHELVLVPLNFFLDDKTIVHSSSMKNTLTGKSVMIGGTGGVGKTSLELFMCRELAYSFISDDIAVVDIDCKIYPNLAFPKIYAYNLVENERLKNLIFQDRSLIDKFQWNFVKKFRGENKVRRSVSPQLLYKNFETVKSTIDDYYVLYKCNNIKEVEVAKLGSQEASVLTLDVVKNEYFSVFQHITWHEYNCKLMGYQPIANLDLMLTKWLKLYNKIFKIINCYTVKIPVDMKHDVFLIQMKKWFQ